MEYNNYITTLDFLTRTPTYPSGVDEKIKVINQGIAYNLMNQSTIFHIESNISEALLKTKNKIFLRPLPFPDVFIDVKIRFDCWVAKGIYLYEFESEKYGKDVLVKSVCMNEKENMVIIYSRSLGAEIDPYKNPDPNYLDKYLEFYKKQKDVIRQYVCSFLDFLNEKDIEYVVVERSEKNRLRAVRNGKYPIKRVAIIRIFGELKKYFDSIDSIKRQYSHKFWVRGHYRHYKMRRIWIKPFIKGKGLFIKKDYKIE